MIFSIQINNQYVFITDVNILQASDDPISNHIDSILSGLINTSIISTGKNILTLMKMNFMTCILKL